MSKRTAFIFVALILGLGWAIRGHFGHEHGAAWAGAMASMAVVVAAGRKDWSARLPVLAVLGGIGWGVGGMMSYGIIVGYGRGTDFANVYYGLAMLGVVGALYGFIGGGLLGLGLESTENNRPRWASLFTEMIAGGLLFWYVIIAQFEWKMTPPRSELWAACLGASVALAWFAHRYRFTRALRLAGYSALGGGFGFAFGNFLQVMGNVTGLSFNWWNVMEFSLGFFGGLGMAYGVFTRDWPESIKPSKTVNWSAVIFLLFVLPAVNIIQSFEIDEFKQMAERLGMTDLTAFAHTQMWLGWLLVLVFTVIGVITWKQIGDNRAGKQNLVAIFLFEYSAFYILLGHIKKAFFYGQGLQLEQYLYWVVFIATFAMWYSNRSHEQTPFVPGEPETWQHWAKLIGTFLVILAVCTFIAIHSHGALPGSHERF